MPILAAAAVPHPPIILPEVGHGEEHKIQKTIDAYRTVMSRISALRPDTVIVTSPHAALYRDYFHISPGKWADGDMGIFRAGGVRFHAEYDTDLVDVLSEIALREKLPAGIMGEKDPSLDHGTMIPLYFLNQVYSGYRTVRIGLSGLAPLEHYRLGRCIAEAADRLGRRAVLLASGDLSHKLKEDGPYGFAPEGPEFDRQITEAFAAGDFMPLLRFSPGFADAAAECGLRSFQIMAGALDGKAVTHELLSYEGPFGVGYGVALFEVTGEDAARRFGTRYEDEERRAREKRRAGEDDFVRLARLGLETYVRTGRRAAPPDGLPTELLHTCAGAFVSLKQHGLLRGCIGTIAPTAGSLAEEILRNAVSAGTDDPRFPPVTAEELPELVYSVDVLSKAEEIGSPGELDARRYGVIVQSGGRRGLLLPDLEGVSSAEEQIAIARQKAGIHPSEPIRLFRFEVVRHR